MAKAARRSKPPRRKLKRGKAPAFVERLRQFEREAAAYWDRVPRVSAADRAEDSRALLIRDGFAPPSGEPSGRPAATTERSETTKQAVLRHIADTHCPNGRPLRKSRPMSWPDFLKYHIAPRWDEACDALDLPPSKRPALASSSTVSRFFQRRSARG